MRKAILLALTLSGCATTWYKPDSTDAEFNQDEYACQRDAFAYGGIAGSGGAPGGVVIGSIGRTSNRTIYNACMRARGYTTEKP